MAELCFATYCVVFKDLIGRYSPVTLMKWMFTYAAICCIPFSYNGLASINFTTLPTAVYADLAFIVFGATFLSYLLVPIGQHRGFARRSSRGMLFATHRQHRCSPYCGEWTGSRRPRERRSCWFSWESTWSTAVNRGPRWKPKRSKPHAVPLRMRLLCPTFRKVPDAPEKRPPRKRLTNNCSNRINISVSARNRIMAIAPYSGNISA